MTQAQIVKPRATISELTFSSEQTVQLLENDKVIFVGPNNSGKSQSLRDIINICQSGENAQALVVKSLVLQKTGSANDLKDYLDSNAELIQDQYRISDYQIHKTHCKFWDQSEYLINGLHAGCIKNIQANDRLNICNQQSSVSPHQQNSKPQHVMYDDEDLMARISSLFRAAFSKDLMFDYRGGQTLPIHVGEIPNKDRVIDRVGNEYVAQVRENPLLDKQGDGIKSYAGILFEAVASERDITLIDEPEAFLHPPQMRRLGETLSSEVQGQLIVATHSSDILRGFLEGTRGKVRILRIQREGEVNIIYEAEPDTIRELWEKPQLRYSNALEGIFHEQVLLCEDDSDCRLINSVADHINTTRPSQFKDTAYVPTGGKHAIPKVAAVLRRTGVPIKAVFDLDFLAERRLVKDTVVSFGGDWARVEQLWERLDAAVRGGVRAKSAAEIRAEIVHILEKAADDDVPKSEIISAMKEGKSWGLVKKYGEVAIPNGEATKDLQRLKLALESMGIFLVPVGEIEGFCPEIGSHGPAFVTRLLTDVSLEDDRLKQLREFVEHCHL